MKPAKEQNTTGLHTKYYIQKIGHCPSRDYPGEYVTILTQVDPEAEYFVLRLDGKGEYNHVEAGRKAIITYAESIKEYLPHLVEDLIERYGK